MGRREVAVAAFQQKLLAWYATKKRDLPWRKTVDPYKILVSEVMLQQTQVDRVIPKYLAFIGRFPTAKVLAAAPASAVITAWAGLGYNRRALNLQRAARVVVDRGVFPSSPAELDELPGIGPYTAAAVASFAFNVDAAVLDTNVRRVFSRFFFASRGREDVIAQKVTAVLPRGKARLWNNAVMEFGALVCTADGPRCDACPLKRSCKAFAEKRFEVAALSKQSRFEDSDRFYRGRIIDALRNAPMHQLVAAQLGFVPGAKRKRIIAGLVKDGLVVSDKAGMSLP